MQNKYEDKIREDINKYYRAGWEAYKSRQYDKGALLYGKALKLAINISDNNLIYKYHFWKGQNLQYSSKYKLAIVEYTSALGLDFKKEESDNSITQYLLGSLLRCGLEMPTSLKSIQNAIRQHEKFLVSKPTFWNSYLLLIKSNLFYQRGFKEKSWELLLEAWAVWEDGYPNLTSNHFLSKLINRAIIQKKIDLANEYLQKWDKLRNELPGARKYFQTISKMEIARAKQEAEKALRIARNYAPFDSEEQDYLITAYLINNEWKPVRDLLIKYICAKRNSESLYTQANCFTFLGDYHYVVVRELLKLSSVDFKYDNDSDFEIPELITENGYVTKKKSFKDKLFGKSGTKVSLKEVSKHLKNSEWAYLRAFGISKEIDQRLECSVNTTKYRVRLQKLYLIFDKIFGFIPERDLDFFPEKKELI